MLTALQGINDRVEGPELGTAYVRLDGLEGMYGGEARLVSALLHSVPEYLKPRVGLGEGKFPAFVAARVSGTQGATRVPSNAAAFLASHPISRKDPNAPLGAARDGTGGLHEKGHPCRPVRASGNESVEPLSRHRRQLPDSPEGRGVRRRMDLSSLLLHLEGASADGGRHPPQEGLLPTPDAGPVRGQGRPLLHPPPRTLLGEGGPLQADRGRLGEGGPHCQGPVGVRPPPGPRGGDGPYPLQPHLPCIGGADGSLPGHSEGPAPAAGGG